MSASSNNKRATTICIGQDVTIGGRPGLEFVVSVSIEAADDDDDDDDDEDNDTPSEESRTVTVLLCWLVAIVTGGVVCSFCFGLLLL